MALGIVGLPIEILGLIRKSLEHDDLLSLSSTCPSLRASLAPDVFCCVKFTNDVEKVDDVHAIVQKYGQYVRELKFEGIFPYLDDYGSHPGDEEEEAAPEGDPRSIAYRAERDDNFMVKMLPESTHQLLSGENTQQWLPILNKITIHFEPDSPDEWQSDLMEFYILQRDITDEQFANYRGTFAPALRALMAKTWDAVSSNVRIKSLKIDELLPITLAAWQTPKFRAFLGRLETFDMLLWGGHDWHAFSCNTCEAYYLFIQDLYQCFFKHFINLTSLRIESSGDDCALRLLCLRPEDQHPSGNDDIPNLRNLELVRCLADERLHEFLAAHNTTLESLLLRSCSADCGYEYGYDDESGPRWADIFTSLAHPESTLSRLEISHNFHVWPSKMPSEDQKNFALRLRTMLANPPHDRRLFSYIFKDGHGSIRERFETTLERYEEGSDLREYEKLMNVVEQNAKKRPIDEAS